MGNDKLFPKIAKQRNEGICMKHKGNYVVACGDCIKKTEYECPKCGERYCKSCAEIVDYECDCLVQPQLVKVKP